MKLLQSLIKTYYEINKDIEKPNINLFFLPDSEFDSKVKKDFRNQTNCKADTTDVVGNLIMDKKFKQNKQVNVYIRKSEDYDDEHYCLVMFHELSHIHTMPSASEDDAIKYNNKKGKRNTLDGYYFWREFIATYLAYKTLLQTDLIDLNKLYNELKNDWSNNLDYYSDDLFALSILLDKKLDKNKENFKYHLVEILNELEDYRDIKLSVLNKLGREYIKIAN